MEIKKKLFFILLFIFSISSYADTKEIYKMEFLNLTKFNKAQLESNYKAFYKLIMLKFQYKLKGTDKDIPYLQKTIDMHLINIKSEKDKKFYLFQGLGVAFSNILKSHEENLYLCWVKDEYGRDIVLRLANKNFTINAINMIGYKYIDKKDIDIKYIIDELLEWIKKYKQEM